MKKINAISGKLLMLLTLLCAQKSIAQTYCIPTHRFPNWSCDQGYGRLNNVNIAGLNGSELNDRPGCALPDYADRTAIIAPLELAPGTTFYGSLSSQFYNMYGSIWIDLNDDGTFSNSERLVQMSRNTLTYVGPGTTAQNVIYPISLSIPSGAPLGLHRLRVRTLSSSSSTFDPCTIDNVGQTADYLVNISSNTQCGPQFTQHAGNQVICQGSNAIYTAAISGAQSVYWQENRGNGYFTIANDSMYSGATTTTLHITAPTTAMSGYQYRCVAVTNGCVNIGNSAVLWLKQLTLSQPANMVCAEGGTTNTTITPTSNYPLATHTYQWQVDTGTGFNNISAGGNYLFPTSPLFLINNVNLSMNGYQYRAVISNGTCTATSTVTTLTVKPNLQPQYYYTKNATSVRSIPLGGGTSNDNYRAQILYLPGDFGTVPSPGLIKRIYIKAAANNSDTTVFTGFRINMDTVSNTALTSFVSGLKTVLPSTTYTFPPVTDEEWLAIDLATPAFYDPAMPMVVDISQAGKVNGKGGISLMAGGTPVNTAYTGNTHTYGSNAATTSFASKNTYQLGFDMEPCAVTITSKPGTLTVFADAGVCTASNVLTGTPAATTNCGTISVSNNAPAVFPAGSTTIIWSVTNGYATDTFHQTVTVIDNQAPAISCVPNITANSTTGTCSATVAYTLPTATDNCGSATITQTAGIASGGQFPAGTTTNTFTATDASGNTSTCSFTVTVVDNQAPVITCPGNITVTAPLGKCTATVNYTLPVATDNCGSVQLVRSAGPVSGSSFTEGTTVVTYTATDAANNSSTCSFTVTVQSANSVHINVTPIGILNTGGVPTNIYLGYGPQTALLSANPTGGTGYTYSWSPSANLIGANAKNAIFVPNAAGNYTYTVTATNSEGCSSTQSVTFCVIDVNAPGGLGGKVYLCHNGNTISVSAMAVPAHLNHHSGDRLGKCSQSCGSANKNADSEEDVVTHEELVTNEVKVYPNPSNGNFVVELPAGMANADITMLDMTGKLVARKNNVSGTVAFSQYDLAKGVYMIYVRAGTEAFTKRVTIN